MPSLRPVGPSIPRRRSRQRVAALLAGAVTVTGVLVALAGPATA